MKKVIIFSLLLLCLLVAPVSAWEMSFEGHLDDLDPDENINQGTSGYTLVAHNNNLGLTHLPAKQATFNFFSFLS